MNLNHFSLNLGMRLFFIGAFAISAMFLPGISGSTVLLIFGAYIPIMNAVKSILSLHFEAIPSIFYFVLGILFGTISVVKVIQLCLKNHRDLTMFFIVGMMLGSFYAIIMGPTTLQVPQVALSFQTFHFIAAIIGVALVIGLQVIKERRD